MTVELRGFRACEKALGEADLRQALYDEGAVLMDGVLVNLHGEEHRARRLLEMQVFRRNFFRHYEEIVVPNAFEQVVGPIVERGDGDVVDIGQRVMLHLSVAFAGIDLQHGSGEEMEALLRHLNDFGLAVTLGQAKGDREAPRRQVEKSLKDFERRFYAPSLARRKKLAERLASGEIEESELPRDVLMVLVQHGHTLELSADVMFREVAFFFLAGGHTSVHSLGHAMHHLLTWCESHPEDRSKLEGDLHLVQRFVHESLRLHPSSPIAKRRALAPVQFLSGERAAPGETVVLNLRQANRDQTIFGGNAADFDPYRRLPPGVNETGVTFGMGVHTCLGRALAAGVFVKSDMPIDPETHQFGTVARIASSLLRHGAQKHPERAASLDETIERETWRTYPVAFRRSGAVHAR